MPRIETTVQCPIYDSFRVRQVSGIFDVPIEQRMTERFSVDVPDLGDRWRIGLIVGPSGSGKSTIAQRMFGDDYHQPEPWSEDAAVIDGMPARLKIREAIGLLMAVGLSSPPAWIKPYGVLSGGERFRCDLARALASLDETVVFDEFTSVVDRTVARVASAAIRRAVDKQLITSRFVAVTCHYDVLEWLAPDWTIDMATGEFQWRCLRRPEIRLAVTRCRPAAWRMFSRHHYLTGELPHGSLCYMATWNDRPVTFVAVASLVGKRNRRRIARVVTLPDFQGIGIGMHVLEAVCRHHVGLGQRINATASHPGLIAHCRRSPDWRTVSIRKTGNSASHSFTKRYKGSAGRAVVSFEFIGRGNDGSEKI